MSGSSEDWGGRGGKRKTPTTEVSRDAELKTTKGTPTKAGSRTDGQATVGSDPV